jgi:hypothetical protein
MPISSRKPLYIVPVASTSFIEGAYWDGAACAIHFKYRTETEREVHDVRISFRRAMLVNQRAESFCAAAHIESCYDTLVEIENSPWLQAEHESVCKARLKEAHHYMIYLDSPGSFEVIAESWSVEDQSVLGSQPGGAA